MRVGGDTPEIGDEVAARYPDATGYQIVDATGRAYRVGFIVRRLLGLVVWLAAASVVVGAGIAGIAVVVDVVRRAFS